MFNIKRNVCINAVVGITGEEECEQCRYDLERGGPATLGWRRLRGQVHWHLSAIIKNYRDARAARHPLQCALMAE